MTDVGVSHPVDARELHFTPLESRLAAIWCRVLKLDVMDPHDNFFDLGG
jgi:hypothetical protein